MPVSQEYRWLPFRFERAGRDEVVVTNIAGEWQLLKDSEFEQLRTLTFSDIDLRERLVSKHLVFMGDPDTALRLLTLKSATRFRRIPDLTGLHIFVVTLRCEHACEYCQVSRQNSSSTEFDMSIEDAMKALNIVFES
ncbi:MAG: His-Xaa-Ser system radical SAM maturase HxsB, partial [Planctomycetes bacterium]|nr:His-Xaa-Ser system radical SAM maturase HxsB [Planctomycetota bacterium]